MKNNNYNFVDPFNQIFIVNYIVTRHYFGYSKPLYIVNILNILLSYKLKLTDLLGPFCRVFN